jgi:hypothetical protein
MDKTMALEAPRNTRVLPKAGVATLLDYGLYIGKLRGMMQSQSEDSSQLFAALPKRNEQKKAVLQRELYPASWLSTHLFYL